MKNSLTVGDSPQLVAGRFNVLIVYFSATGNTAKIAQAVETRFKELGADVTTYDITSCAGRRKEIDFKPYQAVVFGAPIYSCRAPRVMREWLKTLNGQHKKASIFFTYGGFGVHPAHYSTRRILEERGFIVVSSAEFLGAHTFNLGGWRAMEGRPDASDFEMAKQYVDITYKRFTGEDDEILGELEATDRTEEQLDAMEKFRFTVLTQFPTRDGEECSMCLVCEEICPGGAMDAASGKVDGGKCIACLACVANCPDNVLKINDMSAGWLRKLEMEQETRESIQAKKSRIYV